MAYTNEQIERHRLHRQLIDVGNKPCALCGSSDRREIHRLVPGHLGGQYTLDNTQVRCFNCHHFIEHPNSKFRVGDRIVLNGRTPARIDLPRHRPRTIIAMRYDQQKQCNFYLVGANCKGANTGNGNPLEGYNDYWFRSYMMLKPRAYHYHRNYIQSTCDKQQGLENKSLMPQDIEGQDF